MLTSAQIVFNSKEDAIAYYEEAMRLKKTVSLPFLNNDDQYQITEVYCNGQ